MLHAATKPNRQKWSNAAMEQWSDAQGLRSRTESSSELGVTPSSFRTCTVSC
jgi:hypothetical protein